MEVFEKEPVRAVIGKWVGKNSTELFTGLAIGVSILALYLIYRKGKIGPKVSSDKPEVNLNMERYVFDIATDDGPNEAVVESSGECYSVSLDGKFIGTMWQDENLGMQWKTEDQELEIHLWDIAANLSESFSRKGFPFLLKGAYPEISETVWKTDETLEVNLSSDTDLEVFSTFLRDEVLNLVDFEEHLDLVVKNDGEAYFKIIGIN